MGDDIESYGDASPKIVKQGHGQPKESKESSTEDGPTQTDSIQSEQEERRIIHSAGPIITEPDKSESPQWVFNYNIDPGFSPKSEVLNTFKSNLRKKYQCLCEGISKQGNPTPLNEIYTELYITESESGEISNEHEVRQIETQSRRTTTEETPIKCNDIFKPLPEQHKHIRSVLTKGVAGIGKTVSVQKFILDWAEEKENQDVHLIFPLPFREINLMKDKTLSLLDLLHLFFPETKEMEIFSDKYKVLFIFDGLDECRLSLDFHSSVRLCDVNESTSVDVMLTKLIKGNLCPSALIWITSRPAAADLIPSECVDRVTEVRGFSDPQKEEYFRKRICDESLSDQIISHLKSSRSLYIMCHIPVFCWISVTVLERILSEAERREIPKTLTQMYTHFLIIQTNITHQKDYEKKVTDEDLIFKLGKLAYEQLVKGNLIFYDEDLRDCGIDVAEASVYSGLCTQIFREEFGLCQRKVYSFVHLTIQEHIAALYVHLSFINYSINVFDEISKSRWVMRDQFALSYLHQRAVDAALESKNGHLDLFLRFLLGLSVESNQNLLHHLQTGSLSFKKEETVIFIQMRIWSDPSPEKSINLFHCLNELGDHSLTEKIQEYLKSGEIIKVNLSPSQWSALIFVLLTSEQNMKVFNLKECITPQPTAQPFLPNNPSAGIRSDQVTEMDEFEQITPDEVLQKLLLVVKECRSAELTDCNITAEGCVALSSALRSNPSHLRELNLSDNNIGDSGVKLISDVLENPYCNLEKLKLSDCNFTVEGCVALTSALRSNPSHMKELNLSYNNLGDSGVKLISDVLKNPQCKLEILELERCNITDEGCFALTSALRSNPSHLRLLNMTNNNNLGDSGVKLISDVLKNSDCKLNILELSDCNITAEGCAALTSDLRSNPSHLTHLNLTKNQLRDSGVKLISAVLENPDCKLEILELRLCNITDEGCVALSSALSSNPSHLRHLNLSNNNLGNGGMELIFDVLVKCLFNLEILRLSGCNIRDEGCVALTSDFPSHLIGWCLAMNSLSHVGVNFNFQLRELDLSYNNLGDSGLNLISDALKTFFCKLEILKF
ncbi:protein NLRC3-like [Misgurnus anguillicaudatus]|uniref:protein NLRC3-like n=1 Tax=Misgurnus anguillicaudatus TaxID=75329 RepID=UPI003CCF0A86